MSVLIRGMEMPTSCDDCRIMMLEDTNCAPELYCGCPIVFKAHPQGVGHRPDYCPLVPVPEHGRCIDADALKTEVFAHDKLMKDGWNNMDMGMFTGNLMEVVAGAPTILEAEEGEA